MDDGGMSQSAAAAISSPYFALPVCTRNRSPPSLKSLHTMGFKTLRGKLVFWSRWLKNLWIVRETFKNVLADFVR